MRSFRLLAVVTVLLGAFAISACQDGGNTARPSHSASATTRQGAGAATASPSVSPKAGPGTASASPSCPYPSSGFDCDMQRRIATAEQYVRGRPGTVGIVVRDRRTGAVWRNGHADTLVWTASTVKLAMIVDLYTRQRAGTVHLTVDDRELIRRMLNSSDDNAADTLWSRYGKADYATRFPNYGLTHVTFVQGFQHYWGYIKCTPSDLDRLINYVLTKLPTDERSYIVGQLRSVAANQQWGVWGAGPAARPGNKDGWSQEQGGWVINSVGFVGPDERYTLSMMNSLNGQGGYDDGVQTITHVASVLFGGKF